MDGMVPPRKLSPDLSDPRVHAPAAEKGGNAALRPTLWRNVAVTLENEISSGTFPEGCRMPTDVALAKRFKVNRHTARRALAELANRGMLKAQPQVGYFVAPLRLMVHIGPDSRLSETIERAGFRAGLSHVTHSVRLPPERVAKGLRVAGRTTVHQLEFVRRANELPVAIVTYWLPADRFPNAPKLLANGANVRAGLARAGVRGIQRVRSNVTARRADEAEAEILDMAPGSTILCLEVVDEDGSGEPVAVVLYRFNASRTELVF